MKIVGLTGGIGSGKSTVAQMFEQLGVPLYYADDRARYLMNHSPSIKRQLIDLFGEKAFEGGMLNRPFIAGQVFNDASKLKDLNGIVHPEVAKDFKEWLSLQSGPYVIQEIPLLFENRKQSEYHRIILVTAPEAIRIDRVVSRDRISRPDVKARINNQLPDNEKIPHSNYLINNLRRRQTEHLVRKIHKTLHQTIS